MNRDGITTLRHARPAEHGTYAPVAHPRPGYRSRSTPGPTAVDRRRWFGLDWCNGHGLKARPEHRGTSCLHRVQQRSTIWLFLFADMVVAVHGGHEAMNRPRLGARRHYSGLGWCNGRTFMPRRRTAGAATMIRLSRRRTTLQLTQRPRRPDHRPRPLQIPFRRWAFFFLGGRLALSSYHTNKTRLAEAPFGPFGDDNGPGSEPPPRNRLRYVETFMPSRRGSPAAVGKPCFPRF
ncbi:hypothetical protein THAOC_30733 [Thalassiosira oceanica]|uniref:Uncharacterized protein n=1 Tax=Thalassiosira oceanica TaxID=159749 RepID=K0R9P8_THAOC|nr:hypothetical protein THAOC_30733 [Thalassiosira oceanica]|eukprot:EJK50318.1 hypothetical protein THAOC_30733 [Thalassiosira oceanica]